MLPEIERKYYNEIIKLLESIRKDLKEFNDEGENKLKMENNKVVLELRDYINMLDEIKEYKKHAENVDFNYNSICDYIKEEISERNEYHIKNAISDKVNLEESLNKKLKNYHYEHIANEFIKTGITFDLVEKLTNSVIKDYLKKIVRSDKE